MADDAALIQYLSALKEGDEIFIARRAAVQKRRVARLTKTQIVLTTGGRYKLANGDGIGGVSWETNRVILPTPEVRNRWQQLRLARWAKDVFPAQFDTLTAEQQVELYRHVKALSLANNSAAATEEDTEDEA